MAQKVVSDHHLTLENAIDGFLLDLQVTSSPVYVRNCRDILTELLLYAQEHQWPGVEDVTASHLRRFLVDIKGRPRWHGKQGNGEPISVSHYETIYRRVKRLFNWLVEEEWIDESPMDRIKRPKLEERVIPVVSGGDFQLLFKLLNPSNYTTPGDRFRAIRNTAVLWLLADTSARKEGITGITLDKLDLERREVVLFEKGRKERVAYFGATTAKALWRYLVERERLTPIHDELWVDTQGNAMRPNWIYKMLSRLGERAEVPKLHTHRFRHTWTTAMLESGAPLPVVEHGAGWVKAPRTYLKNIGDKAFKDWHSRVSPADQIARGIRKRG